MSEEKKQTKTKQIQKKIMMRKKAIAVDEIMLS